MAGLLIAATTLETAAQPLRRRPPDRQRVPPGMPGETGAEQSASLDDRLTSDAQLTRGLQLIEAFVAREKWPEVVAGLQALVEGPDMASDTFTLNERRQWRSLQRHALERLRTLPEAGRRLYQEVYAGVASDLLTQARHSGDLPRLIDVARRFLVTPAGESAAVEVALAFFDRGEYLAAIRWFEALPSERRSQVDATMQVRYALALAAAGREADAQRVIDSLPHGAPGAASGPWSPDAPADWWRRVTKPSLDRPVSLTEWPMFYGSPSRSARTPDGSPLLLEEWSHAVTTIPVVQDQLLALQGDLRDAGRACLPAVAPVVVADRVAVRTLRGVEVLDIRTGALLWAEAQEPATPDRLLSSTFTGSGEIRSQQMRAAAQAQYSAQEAGNFDQHPLTGYLFQDTVSGTLSSDGELLFALTDHAVLGRANNGYWTGPAEAEPDPFGRNWSSNVITAYGLADGDVAWQVGGARTGESFDRALAGTYFFGPPTPAAGELYVIGERDNEIVLFALDRSTGHPLFEQPLANAQANIDADAARRMWACPPAVSNGIIVCPTTTGWTVAVDRLERRLLWAHFCEANPADQRRNGFRGVLMQPLQPLNVRWETSPPIIVGRRVLVAPQELPDAFHSNEPVLVCLDLTTGQELWRQPKEDDGLFVAGATETQVLVVGRSRLRALSLETGREAWAVTLPAEGPPSGRGVLSDSTYALPLANGQMWRVELDSGRVLERLELNRDKRPLGNLALSRGRLISVDPLGVRAFSEQSALEAEIALRRRSAPDDLWSTIRAAELARMRGDRDQALQILHGGESAVAAPNADPLLTEEFRRLRRDCLTAVVESDLAGRAAEFEQLARENDLRSDPQLRWLAVSRGLAVGDAPAVWKLLWPPLSDAGTDQVIDRGPLDVTTVAWEAGQLASLYSTADDSLRPAMDAAFEQAVDELATAAADPASQRRHELLLAFHPQGRRLTEYLANAAETAGDFAAAEIRWRRLAAATTGLESWRAGLRLAQWLRRQRLTLDALRIAADLHSQVAGLPAADREIAAAELAAAAISLAPAATTPPNGWTTQNFAVAVRPRSPQERITQDIPLAPGRESFYDTHEFQFDSESQRLRINEIDGAEYWSLPLRSQQRPVFDQTMALRTDGLQGYSVWQGVIQALSLPDRRVRWSFPIDLRLSGAGNARNVELNERSVLLPLNQFTGQWNLGRYQAPTGMVAGASPRHVLLHGRRAISLLDALSGEVRWTRSGLPPQSMVYEDRDLIYGFPGDRSEPFVLRAMDGAEQPHDVLRRHARQTIAIRNGVLTVVDAASGRTFLGLYTPKSTISGVDAATGELLWRESIDGQARMGWLSNDELLILDSQQRLSAVAVDTGTRRELGLLPGDAPRDQAPIQQLSDDDSVFLLFDRDWKRQSFYMNLPHQQINGLIVCFARDGSGMRWQRRIEEQRLLITQFARSPVLTFFNQLDDDSLHHLQIAVWDKLTGQSVLESNDLRVSQQAFQLDQDFPRRTIRFVGHSLQVVIAAAAATPAPTAPNAPTSQPPE